MHLQGATNFRMADLGVYGVAQPTETGLRTILSVLKCQDGVGGLGEKVPGRPVVWFCTREEPVGGSLHSEYRVLLPLTII